MSPPGRETTLEHYPWVIVRFRCTNCRRHGDARLARLAEKFGATETIGALVDRFAATCPSIMRLKSGVRALDQIPCGGYCPDLARDGPPDLPPAMSGLTVIGGGRDELSPAEARPAERRRRVGEGDR